MADLLVYIRDLPSGIPNDDLEQKIRTCIESTLTMILGDVKCYLKLGIAVIRTMNEDDQKQLVNNVQPIVLDADSGTNISFASVLELDSYIVLDQNMSRIPTADEVTRCYAQAYKTEKLPICESVSVQFPNIFRIIPNTLDEAIAVANKPDLKIDKILATVYPHADCSFFEDLPPHTDDNKITSAITVQIGETRLSPTSFYVQCNTKTNNAVVLASKSAKNWMVEGHLKIDGRNISKKASLAYRVLVFPVPRSFDLNRILNHKLFVDRVISHNHINEYLIVELDDLDTYNNCLESGALDIDGHTMNIKPQAVVSGPGSRELDAVNWYTTAMTEIKPDIMTIINDHQHLIFRYEWNAENWIEQMKNAEMIDRSSKKYDLTRHLLRVTVMLNTIAALRKNKYVVDGEEVTLKFERMRTIGYDHKAKLSFGKKISETELKTPYSSTTVKVVNEDCLVLYERLAAEGHRPLVLNMANAVNPGGGYRKGDGAQEENLFRRSNYYHSLDGEIADSNRSERLYCTSKCELKPHKGYGGYYPMDEFGAIYTSDITVFRQTEAKGYAYMKKPLYNVCAIAMAAYRNPLLTKKNTLENKPAINTHRKIENIFAIAHQHKHDCLVLSAFGCGAFRNPPKHVALLFKSVIYQYAGYFKEIYFAVIDDHNTGNRINPDGNFLPFKELLDGLVVEPPKTLRINGVTGPHRILDKASNGQLTLSDACISYLPPCQYGTLCRDLRNANHNHQFSHPPMCSLQDTTSTCDQTNDEVHMFTFMHTTKCKHGGECTSKDPAHLADYAHPDFCKDESHCHDISPDHLFAFRHLPVCRDALSCPKYLKSDPDHIKLFRHCKFVCPHDNCCINFHDKDHMKNTIHSFREPCPFTPYNCSKYVEFVQNGNEKRLARDVEQHCLQYSHVCPFGRQCKTTDIRHYQTSIHIARQLCSDGDKCTKLKQEDHLETFSHPGIRDIRLFCREPGYKCSARVSGEHLRKYRHGQNHNHLNVAPSSNLNSHINFVRNQERLISNVNKHIIASGWKKAKMSPEILDWIRALQPVHRCSKLIFESILVHGHVMSRQYMKLLERPKNVANAVLQHSRVRLIFLKNNNPAVKENAFKLIKALVETEFAKTGTDGITKLDPEHENQINMTKMRLNRSIGESDVKVIHDWTVKIAQASIKLVGTPMGIGYNVDEKMGTDKHVFSILGPHRGYYYGDIVIAFKQEIMFHPDANFSIQAGTKFHSGKTYTDRPWLDDRGTEKTHIEDFHNSKLHCSVPHYELAAATELAALTGMNKKSMNVSLDSVIERWMKVDSHDTFESHLPQLIPLDYIDCVYMPKNVFDSLSAEAQQSARGAFKDSLVITPHSVNLTSIRPGGLVEDDPTRTSYLKFILEAIDEKIRQRIKTPQISRGVVITVPGSKFEEHIVLPMTISQSYDLYRQDKTTASTRPEYTYIYWQAMHGDMMLTIASQKIESGKDQSNVRCLVCYVAGKPSTVTEDYHEPYSYLNDGLPYQHDINIQGGKFRAKSNVFYRACNTDDFLTFCLKLSHTTGEVTLSHAGPNSIYNHEKIRCKFDKGDLDLSRIDYIHVSGGNQDVPIRNLTINHERVVALHPPFDEDFKIDTSGLLGNRRASIDYAAHPVYHGSPSNNNQRVASEQQRQQVASKQSVPYQSASVTEKPSVFGKIFKRIFGSPSDDKSLGPNPSYTQSKYNPSRTESPRHQRSKPESPRHNRPKPELPRHNSPKPGSPRGNRSKPQPPSSDRSKGESPSPDRSKGESRSRDRSKSESPSRDRSKSESPSPDRSKGESPSPDRSRARSSPHNRSESESPKSSRSRSKSPLLISSKLPPCSDSVYCLNQNFKDHIEKYSHPCHFNELCRKQPDEPHLLHQYHKVRKCSEDRVCPERTNPIHRAQYRHTNLPDYLFPCRYQESCYDKSSEHRMKFFHGEELPSIKKTKKIAPAHGGGASGARLFPCRYGSGCRSMRDPQHTAKYSHRT